jgi:hypothetical protein
MSDVYLMARAAGKLYKLSFHRPSASRTDEACQLSLVREFHETLPPGHRHPSGTRHMAVWRCGPPDASGFRLAARHFFPRSGLAARRDAMPTTTRRVLLPDSATGIEIAFYFGPANLPEDSWPDTVPETSALLRHRLGNGETFLVISYVSNTSVKEEKQLRARRGQMQSDASEWSTGAVDFKNPELGAILYGLQPNGTFLLTELGIE